MTFVTLLVPMLLAVPPEMPAPPPGATGQVLQIMRQTQDDGGPLTGSLARKHYRRAIRDMLAQTTCPALTDILVSAVRDSEEADDDATAVAALRLGITEGEKFLRGQAPSRP